MKRKVKKMSKQVQISLELFCDLVDYFYPDNEKNFPAGYEADVIRKQLSDKMQSIINRELFTRYKTAKTPLEREQARREYLAQRDFSNAFISDIEQHYEDM